MPSRCTYLTMRPNDSHLLNLVLHRAVVVDDADATDLKVVWVWREHSGAVLSTRSPPAGAPAASKFEQHATLAGAHLSHGHRHAGLRHGVHWRGDQGGAQADAAGELGGEVYLVGPKGDFPGAQNQVVIGARLGSSGKQLESRGACGSIEGRLFVSGLCSEGHKEHGVAPTHLPSMALWRLRLPFGPAASIPRRDSL